MARAAAVAALDKFNAVPNIVYPVGGSPFSRENAKP